MRFESLSALLHSSWQLPDCIPSPPTPHVRIKCKFFFKVWGYLSWYMCVCVASHLMHENWYYCLYWSSAFSGSVFGDRLTEPRPASSSLCNCRWHLTSDLSASTSQAEITGLCGHVWFMWCWELNQDFTDAQLSTLLAGLLQDFTLFQLPPISPPSEDRGNHDLLFHHYGFVCSFRIHIQRRNTWPEAFLIQHLWLRVKPFRVKHTLLHAVWKPLVCTAEGYSITGTTTAGWCSLSPRWGTFGFMHTFAWA